MGTLIADDWGCDHVPGHTDSIRHFLFEELTGTIILFSVYSTVGIMLNFPAATEGQCVNNVWNFTL